MFLCLFVRPSEGRNSNMATLPNPRWLAQLLVGQYQNTNTDLTAFGHYVNYTGSHLCRKLASLARDLFGVTNSREVYPLKLAKGDNVGDYACGQKA